MVIPFGEIFLRLRKNRDYNAAAANGCVRGYRVAMTAVLTAFPVLPPHEMTS